jgi:hypothetical protein
MIFVFSVVNTHNTSHFDVIEPTQDALGQHETHGLQLSHRSGHGSPKTILENLNNKTLCPLGNFFHGVLRGGRSPLLV